MNEMTDRLAHLYRVCKSLDLDELTVVLPSRKGSWKDIELSLQEIERASNEQRNTEY